ncbi:MAG: Crp/Fnr family transcriptional regulator [Magnetococcales bacterium]|nr:Crp/Fnr family transcriptional regulator [Magnetococcales bacterium]
MLKKDKERIALLDIWRNLDREQKLTLLKFAEFLESQKSNSEEPVSQEPLNLPKPENESAVKALKRLKKSYPMIDADMGLLDDASHLLMEKITGTPDSEVVVKLEALFLDRYKNWQQEQQEVRSS